MQRRREFLLALLTACLCAAGSHRAPAQPLAPPWFPLPIPPSRFSSRVRHSLPGSRCGSVFSLPSGCGHEALHGCGIGRAAVFGRIGGFPFNTKTACRIAPAGGFRYFSDPGKLTPVTPLPIRSLICLRHPAHRKRSRRPAFYPPAFSVPCETPGSPDEDGRQGAMPRRRSAASAARKRG